MLILYFLSLFGLTVYSYALIDPNITFFQSQNWESFRNVMVQLGYYHRDISMAIYLFFIVILSAFYIYFIRHSHKYNPVKIAAGIGILLLFSYPFLSHDLFNYMFDAKIFTFYHQNPYTHKALDFPQDQWLRFMHWTHRTYPYGPVFLIVSFIPSILSAGKFLVDFLLFKLLYIVLYVTSVFFMTKISKKTAVIYALNPLVLIEGLVNMHNDFVALSLGIIGVWFVLKKNKILGLVFNILSGGIKYITLPYVILISKNKYLAVSSLALICLLLGYLSFRSEIQPWYFLALFVFVPFMESFILYIYIFLLGLLLSYYPYIYLGGWDKQYKVDLKHEIILTSFILNGIGLAIFYFLKQRRIIKQR